MNAKQQHFGTLLKSMISRRGISTADFSCMIKTSRTNLHNIESGRRAAGSEIVATILNELDLSQGEREELLEAAAAQSDGLKAGIEVGNWRIATQWWKMFGIEAVKSMGLDPHAPNIQVRWWPVVHEKWLIRCHFHNPDVLVVLGFNQKMARIEAAHRDYDLRTSTPLPAHATHWWSYRVRLGQLNSNGTPIIGASSKNETKLKVPIKPQS